VPLLAGAFMNNFDQLTFRFYHIYNAIKAECPEAPAIGFEILATDDFDIFATLEGGAKIIFTEGAVKKITAHFDMIAGFADTLLDEDVPTPFKDGMTEVTEQRTMLAIVFREIVYDFIILHEIAHIVRGHLGRWLDRLGRHSISESEFYQINAISVTDLKSVELDADMFSALRMAMRKLAMDLPIKCQKWEDESGKQITSAALTAFTVANLFRLFHHFGAVQPTTGLSIHPPAVLRMFMSAKIIMMAMIPHWDGTNEWAEKVIGHTEGIFVAMHGEQYRLDLDHVHKSLDVFDGLRGHLKDIWSELEPFAAIKYGPI
jgi:hypothetical protein